MAHMDCIINTLVLKEYVGENTHVCIENTHYFQANKTDSLLGYKANFNSPKELIS